MHVDAPGTIVLKPRVEPRTLGGEGATADCILCPDRKGGPLLTTVLISQVIVAGNFGDAKEEHNGLEHISEASPMRLIAVFPNIDPLFYCS